MSSADRKKGDGEKLQGQGAYAQLFEDIRSGRLLPGARLREIEVGTRLGISRTPVREAIRQLETDGLVSYLPRVGAVVRQLSYPEVMELYEMRWVLEGTAARLAARSASGLEIEELAEINAEMTREGQSPQDLVTFNRQFHNTLIAAARNRYLVRSVRAIETTLLILGPTTMEDPARVSAAVDEHQAVVDALRGRDEASAEAMMRAHIESAQRTRLRQLRSHGRLVEGEAPDQA